MKRFVLLGGILFVATFAVLFFQTRREPIYRIAGPSMAPTFLGPHYQVDCPACKRRFAIDATRGPLPYATCDRCGTKAPVENAPARPGDVIQADPGKIARFDLVMFQDPENRGQLVTKRVVGLPGETLACRQGDLWINGQRYQKSWEELEALAIPVYETDGHSSRADAPRIRQT
ncbi:MAG: signal peptidase I, partial [Blastopirellula sp. JB062]